MTFRRPKVPVVLTVTWMAAWAVAAGTSELSLRSQRRDLDDRLDAVRNRHGSVARAEAEAAPDRPEDVGGSDRREALRGEASQLIAEVDRLTAARESLRSNVFGWIVVANLPVFLSPAVTALWRRYGSLRWKRRLARL
jgi:hypothetical protein